MPDANKEMAELQSRIAFLEEEAVLLRRRLEDSPSRLRALEERTAETKAQLVGAMAQNAKLADTLREAREQIVALKAQVEKLSAPPSSYGVYLGEGPDGTRGDLRPGPQAARNVSPEVELADLTKGQEVVLNEALNVVEAASWEVVGEVMTLKDRLGDNRLLVIGQTDEEQVVRLAAPLHEPAAARRRLAAGRAAQRLRTGAPAAARGRDARPRGGARHLLLRHRRARAADRGDPGRGRAAVPARRPVHRARAAAPQGHPALRAARLRQDDDRQGGRELAGQARGGEGRARRRAQLLPQHQGPGAAQQVRRRDRAPDPADLPARP